MQFCLQLVRRTYSAVGAQSGIAADYIPYCRAAPARGGILGLAAVDVRAHVVTLTQPKQGAASGVNQRRSGASPPVF